MTLSTSEASTIDPQALITSVFGLYRAEWLNGQLYELYTEPSYFAQLQTKRPCVLIGGRGTGKTTVLRGLSYEGQYALKGKDPKVIPTLQFFGLYHRVNTNRINAFKGPELTPQVWDRCFAHYFNLVLCDLLVKFAIWYELHTGKRIDLSQDDIHRVETSLCIQGCTDLRSLGKAIDFELIRFEAQINNAGTDRPTKLSMQGAPIDALAGALVEIEEFRGKQFFFLIDEYENFEDSQQRIVNSILKHVQTSYTFKVGVKELGWRDRRTVNENEVLIHPADYERIDLRDDLIKNDFRNFAEKVCNSRLSRVPTKNNASWSIQTVLQGLTDNEEARLLGAASRVQAILQQLEGTATPEEMIQFRNLDLLSQLVLEYWAASDGVPVLAKLGEIIAEPAKLKQKVGNYGHAVLFSIRKKRAGLRKYYCGWDVFVLLADGNIRYLMELVHQSFLHHFQQGGGVNETIGPEQQSYAAIAVARKNLAELEGLSVEGASLTKLLLSLGRIFGVMAETPHGHTPEVNQFQIVDPTDTSNDDSNGHEDVRRLLGNAVMHQALVRFAGNKLADESDIREFEYMIHPLYSPFFVFSHRRKRKFRLSSRDIKRLVSSPREAIKEILQRSDRLVDEVELPDQLSLFSGFFLGGH